MAVATEVSKAEKQGTGLIKFAPAGFLFTWSSGFSFGKMGLMYAEPLTFLLIRFIAALLILLPLSFIMRVPWPKKAKDWGHIAIAGLFVHAGYLGGVFSAVYHGMAAGVVSLIVGLQPVLTAVLAAVWLKEKVTPGQWLGLVLGLVGVALVVSGKINLKGDITSLALALFALVSITLGTVYQKRFCQNLNLFSGTAIQYGACIALYLVLAPRLETMHVQWTGRFFLALGWLVIVLSIASVMLLFLLIRRGAATKVTSLFYLVPPTTAVMAWMMFGETFTGWALAGLVACAVGVSLVVRQPKS